MATDDPILDYLNTDDMAVRRCQGFNVNGQRCKRTAPPWWIPNEPWWCRTHATK